MHSKRWIELLLIVALIFLAMIILTPRYWEPGQESWLKWASARIFRETGEFPSYSMGPLYVTYLQLFSRLEYPSSVLLEYLITHMFAYIAIYLLLEYFMLRKYALLLSIVWIPHLATVEPGGAILGIGFVCLYLIPRKSVFRNEGYFPPALFAAVFSHPVYSVFLIGHIIGKYIETRRLPFPSLWDKSLKNIMAGLLKITILSFLLIPMITPTPRPEHNHILMDPTYAPVALKSPTDAFFQNGVERYVRRTFPKEEWVYHDWYLSAPEAYGGATTIIQALYRKPETVFRNFVTNMGTGLQLPAFFLSGAFLGPISILFFIFPVLGFLGLALKLKEQKNYSVLLAISIGMSCAIIVLALTTFNSIRYVSTLLPIGFLMLIHIPYGFSIISKHWIHRITSEADKDQLGYINKIKIKVIIMGIIFIIIGLLENKHTINKLILPNTELPIPILKQIQIMGLLFIITGIIFLLFFRKISVNISQRRENIKRNPKPMLFLSEKVVEKGTSYIVVASVILLLLSVQYPSGTAKQIKTVITGDAFLSDQEPVSMINVYPEIIKYINNNTTVLSNEYAWVMAFTDAKLDNIYQIWSLPPFNDSSWKTEEKLNNVDIIMVSKTLESDRSNIGTQTYPRYIFHIKPFLAKALSEGWEEIKIENYGTIYKNQN